MIDLIAAGVADAVQIGNIGGTATAALKIFATETAGSSTYNAANTALKVAQNVGTSRSINAAGTLNASGADYAEYERKRDDCGTIAKGQIVGFDANGLLTDKWSLSIRFGIKSTNPSYVGGDAWATEDIVGAEPQKPAKIEPVMEVVGIREGESDESFRARRREWMDSPLEKRMLKAPVKIEAEYETRMVSAGETDAAYQTRLAAWKKEYDDWSARVESERRKVDRISYSGKAPCQVNGAQTGDYIIASEGSADSIIGVRVTTPAFDQYRFAIGRVNRVLKNGCAEIAVIVH